jgi:DNA-binding ferritin-like protein (Dps family)
MEEILEFLDKAEVVGQNIQAVIGPQIDFGDGSSNEPTHTVAFEVRQLKHLFLKLHYG